MDEFFRFISKSERERVRLIREARAMYDSVFPSADPVDERQESAIHKIISANAQCNEEPFS